MELWPKFDDADVPVIQHAVVRDFALGSGRVLPEVRLGYCVFGEKPEVPLVVLHPALTGSPRAWVPGRSSQGDGWFSHCVGPRKLLDTTRLRVLCVDHLGGNGASSSAEELADVMDELRFSDTVRLTARILREAGVPVVHAVVGGSVGAGQTLEWLFQDEVRVQRLFDISGNTSRTGPAAEFFQIQADLLTADAAAIPALHRRLLENSRDLLGKAPAFDRLFDYVAGQLAALGRGYERTEALRVARKIGFLRFVTPNFFQRKWDDDYRRWTDDALALAGLASWIDHQGETFVHRFSASALASLCRMEARAELHDAAAVAAQLVRRQTKLVGFSVSGDQLFDANALFDYYKAVREALPQELRHLVENYFAYDDVSGHDHFLTPHFLENVPKLAQHLYDDEGGERFETRAIHKGHDFRESTGALIPPVYLTSTFERGNREGFDYTRSGNPNFVNLENILASLENASDATVFANGVAAITAVASTLKSGDLVIAEEVVYGCTYRLFEQVFAKFGVAVEYYDFADPRNFEVILTKRPALVWVESPTNPLLKVIDLRALSKYTARAGSPLLVDNTFASSYCQRPLDLGADLSLSSTTKYINGHSDCLGGVVCTNSKQWKQKMVFAQKALGLNPSPFDAWLITRGLKTLSLRMQQHQANALRLCEFLGELPVVRFARYPLHPSHPQYATAKAQMGGGSGIVTVLFDLPLEKVSVLLNSLERFTLAESLGGIESLVCHPATMSHASVPKAQRERLGITDSLVRFSVGIENAEDLIADVRQALEEAGVDVNGRPRGRAVGAAGGAGAPEVAEASIALGKPIPPVPHAASVSLPRWADVVGYEEGNARVLDRLESGYPRFVFGQHVARALRTVETEHGRPGERALLLPSERTAERAVAFLAGGGFDARVLGWRGLAAVLFSADGFPRAKAFWQHTGAIVSSRRAEAVLAGKAADARGAEAKEALAARVAGLVGCERSDVWLYPTGMAAIAAAQRVLLRRRLGLRTVQFGFPYVDTLKLQEKLGHGVVPIPGVGANEQERLVETLRREGAAAVFTERPTNPLLQSADIEFLRQATAAHGVPLVVDDSINAFVTHDYGRHADILVASLTKYFAGSGDVMGGALVVLPRGAWAAELRELLRADFEDVLYADDAVRLEVVSRGVVERVRRVSEGARVLDERLSRHPRVERVYSPAHESVQHYQRCLRPGAGQGGLLSIILRDAERAAPQVYDRLALAKGPGFGLEVTLVCPYTLLAHYQELAWAAACGIPQNLLRVSVGLEEPEVLAQAFERALE